LVPQLSTIHQNYVDGDKYSGRFEEGLSVYDFESDLNNHPEHKNIFESLTSADGYEMLDSVKDAIERVHYIKEGIAMYKRLLKIYADRLLDGSPFNPMTKDNKFIPKLTYLDAKIAYLKMEQHVKKSGIKTNNWMGPMTSSPKK
jgi:hypothetical protein